MMAGRRAPPGGPASGGIEPPSAGRPSPPRGRAGGQRGRWVRDAAVAATGGAQVRAEVSLLVFGLWAEKRLLSRFQVVSMKPGGRSRRPGPRAAEAG